MKIMITGAGGMLGRGLSAIFAAVPGWQVQSYNREALDVAERAAVQAALASCAPQVVIHLAACTDVDRGEKEPDAVYRTNFLGTWYLCQACAEQEITLVFLSSDLVFDGNKGLPYVETDQPNPLNVYGCSKLAGEQLVRGMVRRHYIIRAGWMFGTADRDHKFAGKIMERALSGKSLHVVMDRIGSPVYTHDLAEKIRDILAERLPWGTYHVVNKGLCSRYDFACHILSYAGMEKVPLYPVSSAMFPQGARRPINSALRNYALELMGCNTMRPWQEALQEYVVKKLCPGVDHA